MWKVAFLKSSHIWTFASGFSERYRGPDNCPCSVYPGRSPSSFVGNNYYYESASPDYPSGTTYYFNDTLWDGAGCMEGTCCDYATQPWFCRQLNQTTQDDIEGRICTGGSFTHRSILIDQLELYIQ